MSNYLKQCCNWYYKSYCSDIELIVCTSKWWTYACHTHKLGSILIYYQCNGICFILILTLFQSYGSLRISDLMFLSNQMDLSIAPPPIQFPPLSLYQTLITLTNVEWMIFNTLTLKGFLHSYIYHTSFFHFVSLVQRLLQTTSLIMIRFLCLKSTFFNIAVWVDFSLSFHITYTA